MRENLAHQLPLVAPAIDHEHAKELAQMSRLLDRLPEAARLVAADLTEGLREPASGREGMTAEQVLRTMLIKQLNGFSYEQLAFHLADSVSYGRFCRFGLMETPPKRSTLAQNIKKVKPSTWQRIHTLIVQQARQLKVEDGRTIGVDSTVVKSHIHHPTDSTLLYDVVRVLVRLMKRGRRWSAVVFRDHRRVAKRRSLAISTAKNNKVRVALYRDLLDVTGATIGFAAKMANVLRGSGRKPRCALAAELEHYARLGKKVVEQTEKRVFAGQSVPASEKIVSIFEPHTDVIVKGGRETLYGHKIFLSVGKSGLVVDLMVEDGNPNDANKVAAILESHSRHFGNPPQQACFDGGFTTKATLQQARALGVKDASFAKKSGIDVMSVVRSTWVYRSLQRFRAGVEGVISFLKRCFGLDRCTFRGRPSFDAYVHASVCTANLVLLARHTLA